MHDAHAQRWPPARAAEADAAQHPSETRQAEPLRPPRVEEPEPRQPIRSGHSVPEQSNGRSEPRRSTPTDRFGPAGFPAGAGAAPSEPRHRSRAGLAWTLVSLLLFGGGLYALWESLTLSGTVSDLILPSPLQVAQAFGAELAGGDLLANTATTVQEALLGFALAAVVAALLGYAIANLRPLELLAAPFIAASQAIPAVAIAPIIILLLGTDLLPHVIICAVVVVFPLLVTTVAGLRGVERDLRDVARVFGASRLQTLLLLELPVAAPVLLGGVKLGLTLSVVGAVVGEFVVSSSGLGFMLNTATANFDVSTRYVALITLAALSITLYGLVTLLERTIVAWQDA